MLAKQVYEGTWEEIADYADVLRGKRVRLVVLPQEAVDDRTISLRERALQLFEQTDALERVPGPTFKIPLNKNGVRGSRRNTLSKGSNCDVDRHRRHRVAYRR